MDESATPVTKAELLRRLAAGYAAVGAVLAGLGDADLARPGVAGGWSAQDLLAHFIAHEQRALEELRHARRGARLAIDHGANDAFNDGAVLAWRGATPAQVRAAWAASFGQVVAAVEGLAEADFDPAGPVAAALDDTIDGALANNTYGHYAEHLPQLLALRDRPAPTAP